MGLLLAADRGPNCRACALLGLTRPMRILRSRIKHDLSYVSMWRTETVAGGAQVPVMRSWYVCEVCDSPLGNAHTGEPPALPTWAYRSRQGRQ